MSVSESMSLCFLLMFTVSFDLVTCVMKEYDRAGKLMDWVVFTV
jgi:hypothetical protein